MIIRDRIVGLERVKGTDLIPNPRNWRTHGKQQRAALEGILREVGIAGAVLARRLPDGRLQLVDGHLRRESLPETELPVLVLDVTEEEADKLLAVFDPLSAMAGSNSKQLAELLAGISTSDDALRRLLEGLGKTTMGFAHDPDEVVVANDGGVQRGDLFALGAHRLMCGDSTNALDVSHLLGGVRPNLMVTDPPYGVDYDPAWRTEANFGETTFRRTGNVTNDSRVDWSPAWQLFQGSIAYVWHAGVFAGEVAASLKASGFEVRSQIIWAKQHIVPGRGAYHWQHEPCWYVVRKGEDANWQGDRKQTTLWEVASATGWMKTGDPGDDPGDSNHSTQKPVEVFRRPINNHTAQGDAVYDPFVGSGTAIIAAEMLHRSCFAMEISPAYVATAIARWEKFTGQKAGKL